jgi:hypothetical protein
MPWKSIDTAPKDREIMIWAVGHVWIVSWHEEAGGWLQMDIYVPDATHWDEVPEGPAYQLE